MSAKRRKLHSTTTYTQLVDTQVDTIAQVLSTVVHSAVREHLRTAAHTFNTLGIDLAQLQTVVYRSLSTAPNDQLTALQQAVQQQYADTLRTASGESAEAVRHLLPVCHHLLLRDIIALRQVSKQWRTVCEQPAAWLYVSASVHDLAPRRGEILHALQQIPSGTLSHLLHLQATDYNLHDNNTQQDVHHFHRIAPNIVKLSMSRTPDDLTLADLRVWRKLQLLQCETGQLDILGAAVQSGAAVAPVQCLNAPVLLPDHVSNSEQYTDTINALQQLNPTCLAICPADSTCVLPPLQQLRHLRITAPSPSASIEYAGMHQLLSVTLQNIQDVDALLTGIAAQCSALTSLAVMQEHRSGDAVTSLQSLRGAVFQRSLAALTLDGVPLRSYLADSDVDLSTLTQYTALRTLVIQYTGLSAADIIQLCEHMPHLQLLSAMCNYTDHPDSKWTQVEVLQCLPLIPNVHTLYLHADSQQLDVQAIFAALTPTHALQRIVATGYLLSDACIMYTRHSSGFAVCQHADYEHFIDCAHHSHACSVTPAGVIVDTDKLLFQYQYGGDTIPYI